MSLNVNTNELEAQASDLDKEVDFSRKCKKNADNKMADVKNSIHEFHLDIEASKHRLTSLLSQAQSTLVSGQNYLDTLTSNTQRLHQQITSAKITQRRAIDKLDDLTNSSVTIDSITARSISDTERTLSNSRNKISLLTSDLRRTQTQVQNTRTELSHLRDIVEEIKHEISETDTILERARTASNSITRYEGTQASFTGSFDRAEHLSNNVFIFAAGLKNTDAAGAVALERIYISSISRIPPMAKDIITYAESQIGAAEKGTDFVPGKEYGQKRVAWCADFATWVLRSSGVDVFSHGRDDLASSYMIARAWSIYGDDGGGYGRLGTAADARPGDLLIDRYNGKPTTGGHISIVVETNVNGDPNLVRTVGGNESNSVQKEIKNLVEKDRYLITIAELNN